MPTSEARKRACKKYEQEKIDRIPLRVPRGKKAQIQERATSLNESINAYINRIINEDFLFSYILYIITSQSNSSLQSYLFTIKLRSFQILRYSHMISLHKFQKFC